MTLLKRFQRIIRAEINDRSIRAGIPEKDLTRLIRKLKAVVREYRKTAASSLARQRGLESKMNEYLEKAAEWRQTAARAGSAGKEELARQAGAKCKEFETQAGGYELPLTSRQKYNSRLDEVLFELQSGIDDAELRIMLHGAGGDNTEAGMTLNRLRLRLDLMEDKVRDLDSLEASAAQLDNIDN